MTTRIAVAGDGREEAAAYAADRGATAHAGRPADVLDADADVVVAIGEDALLSLVRAGLERPVLPVAAGRGVESVPRDALPAALDAVLDGDHDTTTHRLLDVHADGETHRALMDAMLVTRDAASISEYAVRAGGRTVDSVRADGVLVATPAGSTAYNAAADGPVLGPGVDGAAVVPIAPFRIDHTHWTLDLPLTLTVERDEAAVTLLVDDADAGAVDPHDPVEIRPGAALPVVTTPASQPFFD